MTRSCVIIILIFSSLSACSQDSLSRWSHTLRYSFNYTHSESNPYFSPRQFEGRIGQFTAIPVSEFKSLDHQFVMPTSGAGGVYEVRYGGKSGALSFGLGYEKVQETTSNTSGLRMTDQIERGRGFVKPSRYEALHINMETDVLNARFSVWHNFKLGQFSHRFGVGVYAYTLLRSRYEVLLFLPADQKSFTYEATDVSWKVFVYNATFELRYDLHLPRTMDFGPFLVHLSYLPVNAYFSGMEHKKLFPDQYRALFRVGLGYQLDVRSRSKTVESSSGMSLREFRF